MREEFFIQLETQDLSQIRQGMVTRLGHFPGWRKEKRRAGLARGRTRPGKKGSSLSLRPGGLRRGGKNKGSSLSLRLGGLRRGGKNKGSTPFPLGSGLLEDGSLVLGVRALFFLSSKALGNQAGGLSPKVLEWGRPSIVAFNGDFFLRKGGFLVSGGAPASAFGGTEGAPASAFAGVGGAPASGFGDAEGAPASGFAEAEGAPAS